MGTACNALGASYSWVKRAFSKTQCAAHGKVCRDAFREWDVNGMSEATCNSCPGSVMVDKVDWRGGSWQAATMRSLDWKPRNWTRVNEWSSTALDVGQYQGLAEDVLAAMFGKVWKTEIRCKFESLIRTINLVACACGDNKKTTCFDETLDFTVVDETVFKDSTSFSEIEFTGGSITPNADSCAAGEDSCSVSGKMVPYKQFTASLSATRRRRRLSSGGSRRRLASTSCADQEIVKNAAGVVVGQVMGNGVTVSTTSELCLETDTAIYHCSTKYPDNDFSDSNKLPQSKTISLNSQGHYCANVTAGTYFPIARSTGWETATSSTGAASTAVPSLFAAMFALLSAVLLTVMQS